MSWRERAHIPALCLFTLRSTWTLGRLDQVQLTGANLLQATPGSLT